MSVSNAVESRIAVALDGDQPWMDNVVPSMDNTQCPVVRFTPPSTSVWATHACAASTNFGCTLKPHGFTYLADGEVEDPATNELVNTERECARRCKIRGAARCRGYSVSWNATASMVSCRMPADGDFYWLPSSNGTIYFCENCSFHKYLGIFSALSLK